jgi:3-deoxy-D-manno-octulosonate 8-phosphate phosphatase (KDO 8-P phosphatase)
LSHPLPTDLAAKAVRIRALLFDVDGVLTDGTILVHADGSESKHFHIRDGTGIVLANRAGLLTGVLSARQSGAVTTRARQLSMAIVRQGVLSKGDALDAILSEHGLQDHEIAFMGDDLLDLPVMTRVGLATAPADGAAEIREHAHWVSRSPGGRGAARELVELVLRAQGHWDRLVRELADGSMQASIRASEPRR